MSSSRSTTLALLPKFTGSLSLIGSTYIFQDVVFHKKTNHRVYHRIVLGLSCSDMVASVVNILSTWPIPEGTPGVMFASGTTQTCTAQGFFNELGNLATPLYNASLCLYYVLVIRNAWIEERIRTKAEPFMHALPITIALTISILGLPFKLYNNSGWLCWIASYPAGCSPEDGTCTRGEHADIFRWVHYTIIWSAILFVTGGMYSIYRKVKLSERIQGEESMDREVVRRGEKSKKVAIQAALFVGGLYLTWIFTTITRIYNITTGQNSFVLLVLMAIFFPLQGFFNCLVYLRPRYLRSRSRNPDATFRHLIWLTLHHESHAIHGLNQNPVAGRRESYTRSYYAVSNSNVKQSSNNNNNNYGDNDIDTDDINTVNAIASVSDYTPEARAAAKQERLLEEERIRQLQIRQQELEQNSQRNRATNNVPDLGDIKEIESTGKRESNLLDEGDDVGSVASDGVVAVQEMDETNNKDVEEGKGKEDDDAR